MPCVYTAKIVSVNFIPGVNTTEILLCFRCGKTIEPHIVWDRYVKNE